MAGSSSLHLRRSCHSKPVLESHLDILGEGAFSDVTFIVGPRKERIPGHQIFLKTRSPVFEVMFSERWNQDSNKEVVLEDVDPKIFKLFLQYIYADTLEAKVPEVLQLLQIAHRYDVQMLVSKCEKLLESKVALDDAVDVFQVARKYDNIQLMDKVGAFMAASMSKIQSHQSFSRLDKEFFIYLLKRNDLKIKEVDLFLLALKWATNQTGFTLEQSLQDILPLIRFPTMTLNEITTIVVPTGHLPESTIVELLTYCGSDAQTRKSTASTLEFSTEQRQPADSAVSLYSRDFDDCVLKREEHGCLEDRLDFEISKFSKKFGLLSALYALIIRRPEIALSSISLYCPTTTGNSDEEMDATKTFTIIVEAKRSWYGHFEEVLVLGGVQARAGTMTDVKFFTPVPLYNQKYYSIIVEENPGEGPRGIRMYEVKDFGYIQRNISVAVGETGACLRRIKSFRRRTIGEHYNQAQLIYKLGLQETS